MHSPPLAIKTWRNF